MALTFVLAGLRGEERQCGIRYSECGCRLEAAIRNSECGIRNWGEAMRNYECVMRNWWYAAGRYVGALTFVSAVGPG